MAEYISKIEVEINGETITAFSGFTESTITRNIQVELMNTTGHAAITVRRQVSLDYVIPRDSAEFDFSDVKGGTVTVEYENGVRKTWGGCYTLEEGDTTYGTTDAATKTVTLGAESYATE